MEEDGVKGARMGRLGRRDYQRGQNIVRELWFGHLVWKSYSGTLLWESGPWRFRFPSPGLPAPRGFCAVGGSVEYHFVCLAHFPVFLFPYVYHKEREREREREKKSLLCQSLLCCKAEMSAIIIGKDDALHVTFPAVLSGPQILALGPRAPESPGGNECLIAKRKDLEGGKWGALRLVYGALFCSFVA